MIKKDEIHSLGEATLKTISFSGGTNKKTLVITAGVHGGEYVPILSVQKLMDILENKEINGKIIIAPLLNEDGFYNASMQVNPIDNKNLNRAFPGDANGTYTEQLAKLIEDTLYSEANFLLDLHAGDINELATNFLFFPVAFGEDIRKTCADASKAIGVPFRVCSTSDNGLYSYAAKTGIPSLLLEWGGLGAYTNKEVDDCTNAIINLIEHLGIIEKENNIYNDEQIEINNSVYISSIDKGFWKFNFTGGDKIKKNDVLGVLTDEDGNVIQKVIAEFDGIVYYATHSLGVIANYPLIAYGQC